MNISELKENFSLLDKIDKLNYLIDLGNFLPKYPIDKKNEEYKISGCSSNVYIYKVINSDKLNLFFYSDSKIINGILFIIYDLLNGKNISNVDNIDFEKLFNNLGITELLSLQRQIGLSSIIQNIKSFFSWKNYFIF